VTQEQVQFLPTPNDGTVSGFVKTGRRPDEHFDFVGSLAFLSVHFFCLTIFFTGVSFVALTVGFLLYVIRMWAITAGFHRYFAHRSFQTSRVFQFIMAFIGTTSAQLGPLWWAGHHRHHHRFSDMEEDLHSPVRRGFWWSHCGWIVCKRYGATRFDLMRDFASFRELRWLNKYNIVAPILLATGTFFLGVVLNRFFPSLGTSGLQMLVVGFFVSTVFLYHGTFSINLLSHLFGSKRFDLKDESRNNFWLALITLGEGWHNNHHRYPQSERQGFYWWEIDISHQILRFLSLFGIVWGLKTPPKFLLDEARAKKSS